MILAIQFLTIIPVKMKNSPNKADFSRAVVFFPVVGFIIGTILAIANMFLSPIFQTRLVNVVLIVLLTILTGGLHSDGLADTVDGLSAGKSKEKTLEIMRDSHIGTMGVLSLICVFFLKVSLLEVIPASMKSVALMAMPVSSRWSMLIPMCFFPYARPEGKAKSFFEGINIRLFLTATIVMLIPVIFLLNFKGLYILFIIALITLLLAKLISKRIGGITGDVLGAICEINEVLFLISVYIIGK